MNLDYLWIAYGDKIVAAYLSPNPENLKAATEARAALTSALQANIDITKETVDMDDDDNAFVCEGADAKSKYLQIGSVRLTLTEEQADAVRAYFENT